MKKKTIFDLCSPSCTGLGLEILKTIPFFNVAEKMGIKVRLWTFHPLVFNDNLIDIIPLQQGHNSLLPAAIEKKSITQGAYWLPHNHPQGPYICQRALSEAKARNFYCIDINSQTINENELGVYPNIIESIAKKILNSQDLFKSEEHPLYPSDYNNEKLPIIINLVGAHGIEKGISDMSQINIISKKIGKLFPEKNFLFLIHSRVCSNQFVNLEETENVKWLLHLDCDSRVSRILHKNSIVITVEGGLAHSAIYRGCEVYILGTSNWLNQTNYLYPINKNYKQIFLPELSANSFIKAIQMLIANKL